MTTQADLSQENASDQSGYTLVELLITFSIVSILAMFAMPVYQNYSISSKIGSDLVQMRHLMVSMDEKYAINGEWPSSNSEAGAFEPERYSGKYMMSAEVSDTPQPGTVTLTYDAAELPVLRNSDTIIFYPDSNGNWKCDQGTIPSKYRPSNCR